MKRKLTALLCAFALLLLLLPSALGAQTMYITAVNEKILDRATYSPFVVSGTVYVPYTALLRNSNGGVDLGVYGGPVNFSTLVLYSATRPVLTFDVINGDTYDTLDNQYDFRAIIRNGTIFLPASAVCAHFGLEYSNLTTEFGRLIRIKRPGSYSLADKDFIAAATERLREEKKLFDESLPPPSTPTPTPTRTPAPTPSNVPATTVDHSDVAVSFAFRCDSGQDPGALLDALERYSIKCLFLFRPGDMAGHDDAIRRLVAQGHKVGFLVDGATAEECLDQAREGNALLAHIARTQSDFLLTENGTLRGELERQGWLCWNQTLSGIPDHPSVSAATNTANLILRIQSRRSPIRITLDGSALSAQTLTRTLSRLTTDGYDLRSVTETSL